MAGAPIYKEGVPAVCYKNTHETVTLWQVIETFATFNIVLP